MEIEDILRHEAQAILDIPQTNDFEGAVTLLYKYVHEKGGKIIMSGMGKAGQIAINMSTTFSATGSPAVFLHPA